MKLVNFYRKPISMFVMVTFTILLCFWANQTPAAPAAEKSSAATLENSNGENTGFIEQEAHERSYSKGKKFPWLIVALVAVAGGAALYFLVLKKKDCTLTVTVGEGVTGTPAAGTSTNKKGTAVAYSYTLQSGYDNLSVTLDGAAVSFSGSVTMNANHTLAASATKTFVLTVSRGEHVTGTPPSGTFSYASGTNVNYGPYAPAGGYANLEVKVDGAAAANAGTITMNTNHTLTANLKGANIEVNSTPAGANIYLDRVDSGHVTPFTFNFPAAVTKAILLRGACGYKEWGQTVSASLGQTKTVNASLAAGIKEDFTIPASSCWLPSIPSSWYTHLEDHNDYKYHGTAPKYSVNFYNLPFNGDYSVSVNMNRKSGGTWATGIFLGTTTSATSGNGYMFAYYPYAAPNYGVVRMNNYNFVGSGGTVDLIKTPTATSVVKGGLNRWNLLRIVKVGTNYSYYINGTFMYSFSDAAYTPTYCTLIFYDGGSFTEMFYEYVYLNLGSAAGSIPGQPVKNTPEMEKENLQWNVATGERKD